MMILRAMLPSLSQVRQDSGGAPGARQAALTVAP